MTSSPWQLSYIELRGDKNIECVHLVVGDVRRSISPRGGGTFSERFDERLSSAADQVSLEVRRRKTRIFRTTETVKVYSIEVQSGSGRQGSFQSSHVSWTTSKKFAVIKRDKGHGSLPTAMSGGLKPTTEELIAQCPRFRVLVVGKTGAGKSSLIDRVFGTSTAGVADDKPGEAMIEKELISSQNDRFILHDSKGFEPGEGGNYDTVKSFIEARKKEPLIRDQLHAVWFCFPVPMVHYGERLLEDGAETFFEQSNEALRNIPTVFVFTKYDRLVKHMQKVPDRDPEAAAKQYLQTHCVEPIQRSLKDKAILHVAVSSRANHQRGLDELTKLTYERVSESFTSEPNTVSPVPFAAAGAQRVEPGVKIESSINVGKQRYWRALASSTNFGGFMMLDCLGVIHTDIISVWNFHDPSAYVGSEEFRNLMVNMVAEVDAPTGSPPASTNLTRSDTFSGPFPLMTTAIVILPFVAGLALVRWVYESYQRLQNVHPKFMAYIVDLTHVLNILFALKGNEGGKSLTRREIKLAFNAYYASSWMEEVHESIRQFRHTITDRDEIIAKIEELVLASDREAHVTSAIKGIPSVDLEQDEEWYG
ncbi:hypothetical protein PISMIDRAFT_250937 [Pisolithus microcarpus 441]|uniref:G domain-containing protein n=1 Tax=Pisolithus microcarpus 441 TaxID=765257 RepID=A0A0C9YS74_9AGAM|nr:hypothetical protein PISMIDRAFT_250937 [Pisolithus microcarpus 441]